MGSIGRYIFRHTFGAFVLVCASLTALMWITQALRDVDLMTNQGQSIFVFVGITGLLIPLLIMVIAPIALTISVAYMLNKLSNDSELIVMNAAGMPPRVLFMPFVAAGVLVSVLVATLSAYAAPWSLRELRRWANEVRADVIGNIVQPGKFTNIQGLTLQIRQREPNGQLLGVFIDDQRDEKERSTLLAARGNIVKTDRGTFLVLENGSAQRQQAGRRDPTIVLFDSYAFDLSEIVGSGKSDIKYSTRERYLWELFRPTPGDPMFNDQPDKSAPSCTTASPRRSIPSPSCS